MEVDHIDQSSPCEWTLVHQGAESRIWFGNAFGKRVVRKERFRKQYRDPKLDERLTKERQKAEVRALMKLKERSNDLAPLVPTVYYADEREIVMDEIEGAQTLNEFAKNNAFEHSEWLYELFGRTIGQLHRVGLIHGDITTTNFLLIPDKKKLVPIDFGLAQFSDTLEDRAVDLYVLERSLLTNEIAHYPGLEIILKAYGKELGKQGVEVLKKLEEVRLRGRKRSMVG